jgi:hypothetical protein
MSGPRTDQDVERALAAWMDRAAPTRAPDRLLEGTFAATMRTRQRRSFPWTASVRIGPAERIATISAAWVLLMVLGALVAAALSVALLGGALPFQTVPSATPTLAPSPATSPAVPAAVVAPEAEIPALGPIAMVANGQELWVLAAGRLDVIDTAANEIATSVPIGATADLYNGLAADASGVWATDATTAILTRVDPGTRKVAATIPAGLSPKGVLVTADGVWVADVHGGTVLPIDPATNRVGKAITVGPLGPSGPNWLAHGPESIWVGIPNNSTIARINPRTHAVEATIHAPDASTPCGGFAVERDAVWITGCSATASIVRVDPTSNTVVATVDLGGYGYNPTLINGAPWVSVDTGDAASGRLVRIDTATNSIDRVLVPGPSFGGGGDLVVAAGSVWVVDGYNNTVLRLPLAAFGP